jgi:ribosomal protein S18 acetylase RimI-like enzyme
VSAAAEIRHATPADAGELAEFARRCFTETYAAVNDPKDMALHLERTFGADIQAREIAEPAGACLVAVVAGTIAGYTVIREGARQECVVAERPCEVKRFYVDHAWHGRGLAPALMMAARAEASARGASTLWLTAWEENPRALGFYKKMGFEDVGVATFLLGSSLQTDRVLALKLEPA